MEKGCGEGPLWITSPDEHEPCRYGVTMDEYAQGGDLASGRRFPPGADVPLRVEQYTVREPYE